MAGVRTAFDPDGTSTDAGTEASLRGLAGNLNDFVRDLLCPRYALEAMVLRDATPWTANLYAESYELGSRAPDLSEDALEVAT